MARSRFRLPRWVIPALVVVLIGIQFVPVERTNPRVQTEVTAPEPVLAILHRSCYNCHSNETQWPWYSHVAPVSWLVSNHVKEARGDLNFSEWPTFDLEELGHAFHDIEEEIDEGEMPLWSYTLIHREAVLSADDRETLLRWARENMPEK